MSAATPKTEERDLQNADGGVVLERFRVAEPLKGYRERLCLCCGKAFSLKSSREVDDTGSYPRCRFEVCNSCFVRLYVTTTASGRLSVQTMLDQIVPPMYRQVEFNTLDVSGPGGQQVAAARDAVAAWAKLTAADKQPDSLYLYSEPGSHGSGCGCGKTSLAWAAFKFISRRVAHLDAYPWTDEVMLLCGFLDVRDAVRLFFTKRAQCFAGQVPYFRFPEHSHSCWKEYTFDQYLEQTARLPVLFLDDVGQGQITGMLADTYEVLIDRRCQAGLPTFYTSNYSPSSLHDVMGNRLASRVLRGNCQIVELCAPDYWLTRNTGRAT